MKFVPFILACCCLFAPQAQASGQNPVNPFLNIAGVPLFRPQIRVVVTPVLQPQEQNHKKPEEEKKQEEQTTQTTLGGLLTETMNNIFLRLSALPITRLAETSRSMNTHVNSFLTDHINQAQPLPVESHLLPIPQTPDDANVYFREHLFPTLNQAHQRLIDKLTYYGVELPENELATLRRNFLFGMFITISDLYGNNDEAGSEVRYAARIWARFSEQAYQAQSDLGLHRPAQPLTTSWSIFDPEGYWRHRVLMNAGKFTTSIERLCYISNEFVKMYYDYARRHPIVTFHIKMPEDE